MSAFNLSPYFPRGLHRDVFAAITPGRPLVVSGVSNAAAKGYFAGDLLEAHPYRNVFWLVNEDKDIYETRNNLQFWMKRILMSLDHLGDENRYDYRITETVARIHSQQGGVCLLNYRDLHLPLPTYQEIAEGGCMIHLGQEIRLVEFFNQLLQNGYQAGTDVVLAKGEYRRSGGMVNLYPPNYDHLVRVEVNYDKVTGIWAYNQETKQLGEPLPRVDLLPVHLSAVKGKLSDHIGPEDLVVLDDLDEQDDGFMATLNKTPAQKLIFTSFPKNDEPYQHLRYLSVLKYYNLFDLLNDLREKIQSGWGITILTKRVAELAAIFNEERIRYATRPGGDAPVVMVNGEDLETVPASFQNPQLKIQLLTDREIFNLSRSAKSRHGQQINLDFLTGLRVGDLVVHLDHGIGRFLGVVPRTIEEIHREYLEIAYAENDRLFVPIDQADKISKYVGGEENEPALTRLGSVEWKHVSQKVKKETQKAAKELLELYARRARAKRPAYLAYTDVQREFDAAFPYEETPGQIKAIQDVMNDMDSDHPMDRLVCGDVGFGKTEVAMRAAFRAAQAGRQVAFISPITILADQHYRTFLKRAEGFPLRLEMLSRFRTPREQKKVLERLKKGDLDVVIGTHRVLQADVQFANLGLVIIDEEQRFGVKQKEKLKTVRDQVDILTMTATPIPRTLNMSLNKLRDISTITTPPPGRLPIITEVRRYSDSLIMEALQKEIDRGGQVYYLHNRVETIESIAEKLRTLMPKISFVVAHGQLPPAELEKRIVSFKEARHQVLISSTIIENGIDLPNANTLIVDDAENFGLSQLYQLRGRIGRSKTQAYAFFLYQSRQPRLDARRRLKAIVDASELGSGFQVAMRDLEIRGAGDILGINQHGTIRVVGVNHFLRMLNKAVEELQEGRLEAGMETKPDVSIELPLEAYIPDTYIPDTKDKINAYQKLSSVTTLELLEEFRDDLMADYGHFPTQVFNLFQVLQIKILAKKAGLTNIKAVPTERGGRQILLSMGASMKAEPIVNLLKHNPRWFVSGDKLKIDMKTLGFNWLEQLKDNVRYLVPEIL